MTVHFKIDETVRKITCPESPPLIENNRAFQNMLTDGVEISSMGADGEKHDKAWLVDTAIINRQKDEPTSLSSEGLNLRHSHDTTCDSEL